MTIILTTLNRLSNICLENNCSLWSHVNSLSIDWIKHNRTESKIAVYCGWWKIYSVKSYRLWGGDKICLQKSSICPDWTQIPGMTLFDIRFQILLVSQTFVSDYVSQTGVSLSDTTNLLHVKCTPKLHPTSNKWDICYKLPIYAWDSTWHARVLN
jgi:hypothetical protein